MSFPWKASFPFFSCVFLQQDISVEWRKNWKLGTSASVKPLTCPQDCVPCCALKRGHKTAPHWVVGRHEILEQAGKLVLCPLWDESQRVISLLVCVRKCRISTKNDLSLCKCNFFSVHLPSWSGSNIRWGQAFRLRHLTTGHYLALTEDQGLILQDRGKSDTKSTAFSFRASKVKCDEVNFDLILKVKALRPPGGPMTEKKVSWNKMELEIRPVINNVFLYLLNLVHRGMRTLDEGWSLKRERI